MTVIIQTLKAATASLMLPPEVTPPFEVFFHVNPSTTADSLKIPELLTWTGHSLATPVEQHDYSDFTRYFSSLPGVENNPAFSQRLSGLQTTLESQLTDIRIYQVGPAPGEIYLIGQDAEGNFAGLKLNSPSK